MAHIREFSNTIADLDLAAKGADPARHYAMVTLARLANPLMPHITEEMWSALGGVGLLARSALARTRTRRCWWKTR